jgi:hypothetical protein
VTARVLSENGLLRSEYFIDLYPVVRGNNYSSSILTSHGFRENVLKPNYKLMDNFEWWTDNFTNIRFMSEVVWKINHMENSQSDNISEFNPSENDSLLVLGVCNKR